MKLVKNMNISIKRKLANLKTKLAEIYQDRLAFLYLFGSQARDTAEEGSDIDILVVLSGDVDPNLERSRTLDIIADLSLENDCCNFLHFC